MPFKDTKKSQFYQYQKFNKAPFVIDEVLKCVIENTDG